ncbi:MAG: hypothetical protein ACHRXM_33305 [Isosphaerales bacterium]
MDGTGRNGAAACRRLRPERAGLDPTPASLDGPGQRPMDGTGRNGAFLRLKRDKDVSGCPSSVYLHGEVVLGQSSVAAVALCSALDRPRVSRPRRCSGGPDPGGNGRL